MGQQRFHICAAYVTHLLSNCRMGRAASGSTVVAEWIGILPIEAECGDIPVAALPT
jgi:hypothetical protein